MSGFTPMPASRAGRKTAAIMFPVVGNPDRGLCHVAVPESPIPARA